MRLIGWEAPNTPEISEEAWALFTASKANLLKTRLYHPISVYERALRINPATEFLLRPTDEGRLDAREQFEKARPIIAELLRRRYNLRFITWSEPDHIDGRYGGPQNRSGALEFRAQLWRFVLLLRAAFPTLRLVSPPLVAMGQVSVFDEICGEVYRLHDDIGRHLYWQHDNELSEQWGLRVKLDRQRYPNKTFVVAEIGDSSNDGKPESEWIPSAIRYSRIARCLGVLKGLGWVDGAVIFILPGTPEWRGFWPDLEAARSIAGIVSGSEGGSMSLFFEFTLGFKAYAEAHPEVGQPIESLQYDDQGNAWQHTTTGLLFWHRAENAIHFFGAFPKA